MKQVVHGAFLGIIFIFTLIGTIMIESRTNRESNAAQALKKATKSAVQTVLEEQSYTINSNEQFVAALSQVLCDNLISNSQVTYDKNTKTWTGAENINSDDSDRTTPDKNLKLTLEIVKADYIKGILSLNIVEEYSNPIGTPGTCEYATTVIFDEEQLHEQYTIEYYNSNGIIVGSYVVKEGDTWPEPKQSVKAKNHITSWGSHLGGGGRSFSSISRPMKNSHYYIPYKNDNVNMNTYSDFYNSTTHVMKIYGNYQ